MIRNSMKEIIQFACGEELLFTLQSLTSTGSWRFKDQ